MAVPETPDVAPPPAVNPPDEGIQVTIPPTGGVDDKDIPWIITDDGRPTIDLEQLPDHLDAVSNEDGSYSIFQVYPWQPSYLGTFHRTENLFEKVFKPNPGIPIGLVQIAECPPAPWWSWPLMGGLFLPWLIPLFRRKNMKVNFETGIDEKNYFQMYERGDKVDVPLGIEKEAYVLDGWYLNKKFSNNKKWDFDKKIRKNITLHAKWISPSELNEYQH